jgi:type II secretory pathway pseudopilin PulG
VRARLKGRSQAGYLMVGMVAAVAILLIFSDLAFQKWVDVLRRDLEAEMMFRAQDLVRAIQRYRRDHGGAPPMRLEDLMQPGPRNQYYLRQMWKDPLVKDGKWGLVYAGPGGEIVDPNSTEAQDQAELQQKGGFGKPFANPSSLQNAPGDPSQIGGATPAPGLQPMQPKPGANAPFGISAGQGGDDKNAGGKQLSGLPIAGVRTLCKDKPFRVWNGQTEYAKWLFTYLDLERVQLPGQQRGAGSQPPPPPFGQQPGSNFGQPGQPPGSFEQQPGGKKPFGSGGKTFGSGFGSGSGSPFGKAKRPPPRGS